MGEVKIFLGGFLKWSLVFSLWFPIFGNFFIYGQTVSIKDLLIYPDKFEGETVEIEGEVISETLRAKEGAWINISFQGYNIGIFLWSASLAKEIKYQGSYKEKGDRIMVKGIFYKNCSFHQERDVHAEVIEVLERGSVQKELLYPFKIKLVIIFFIICLTIILIYLIKVHNERKN